MQAQQIAVGIYADQQVMERIRRELDKEGRGLAVDRAVASIRHIGIFTAKQRGKEGTVFLLQVGGNHALFRKGGKGLHLGRAVADHTGAQVVGDGDCQPTGPVAFGDVQLQLCDIREIIQHGRICIPPVLLGGFLYTRYCFGDGIGAVPAERGGVSQCGIQPKSIQHRAKTGFHGIGIVGGIQQAVAVDRQAGRENNIRGTA